MSAKKYMSITVASKATATRAPQDLAEAQLDFTTAHETTVDLQDRAENGIFVPSGVGRSTRYQIEL